MWEDEGVAGRPPLWKVSQRGPGIEAAVGLQRRVFVCVHNVVSVGGLVGWGASLARTATELPTTPRPRGRGGASQMG